MSAHELARASVQINIRSKSGYSMKTTFKGPNPELPNATPKAAVLEAIAELVNIAAVAGFGPEAANTADQVMVEFSRRKP